MKLSLSPSAGTSFELWPEAVKNAAGIDRLGDLRDWHIRELPKMRVPETEGEYADFCALMRDSFRKRERLWLAPMSDAQIEQWRKKWPLSELGPKQQVNGRLVTPVGIAPRIFLDHLLKHAGTDDLDLLHRVLDGQDGLLVSARHERELTNQGIRLIRRSTLVRIATNFEFWAYAVVLVYSALRVLPVSFVEQFEGSLWALWAIDLGTAIPYTWGILTMFTAKKFLMRLAGMVTTVVTFTAPYVYFALNGKQYPPIVIVVIALLIASTILLEGTKAWMDKRVSNNLRRVSPETM